MPEVNLKNMRNLKARQHSGSEVFTKAAREEDRRGKQKANEQAARTKRVLSQHAPSQNEIELGFVRF